MNKISKHLKALLIFAGALMLSFIPACSGGGDTSRVLENGSQFVSNGGSGSTLRIELEEGGNEIPTAGRVNFKVYAVDPNGAPLSFIRIFCESEKGIAIIEPSSGGVAFEHTGASGAMSGVLGGLTPGSFLVECRGPQGFNLVARTSFKVVGDIPSEFVGFPGAAGGNLGGGVIIDPVLSDVTITQVTFSGSTGAGEGSRSGDIDLTQQIDCDGDLTTVDPEPFFADNFNAEFVNAYTQRIFVQSVEISVYSGSSLVDTSVRQLGGLIVLAGASTTLSGPFTEVLNSLGGKSLVGSSALLVEGTYNVVFNFTFTTANGESAQVEQSASVRMGSFNNCDAA